MSKGERHRKERRMEKEQQDMIDRVEAWTEDMDTCPEGPFYMCSMDTVHNPTCEPDLSQGGTERLFRGEGGEYEKCITMDKWALALFHERFKWKQLGIATGNININMFVVDCQIRTFVEILETRLDIPKDEINEVFARISLTQMRQFRETVEPEIREARRQSIIVPPGMMPPDGRMN